MPATTIQTAQWELTRQDMEEIREKLGIDMIGTTTAEPFHDVVETLKMYREKGYESGFEHPVIEERIDPEALVPGARSIVAIAMAYHTEQHAELKRPKGIRGALSKYAWGLDYHHVLRDKLNALAAEIGQRIGRPIAYNTSVDTGPMVDRSVANRAGLGWFGKHCSIITEKHGSWVFLGQLVTDVAIEPSPPAPTSLCGDCDLCIRACPTGALVDPYTTDSSKCLSYITQMKGFVPEEFRTRFGTRIWGCDTCQIVCPSNKGVEAGTHEGFLPDQDLSYPDLLELLKMSNREFKRIFGKTAAAWRGLTVMKRNAIIALGNIKDKRATPILIELLKDERPEIRGTAAWALGKIGGEEARRSVEKALSSETDRQVRHEMRWVNGDHVSGGNIL
ncbi:tRNA epoxyqueuosine(34) reductase QueG [Effusibacillus lacus]|uniref:tRNA epoxyqueuosine(34) reductase QueG n=1 Tax=Effusibacillus lacus TaxID=1348429 RepID=A0A292YPS4_9BACL|nr:tRNA epoxyqueuosine(34) reductase QueG [Effusibacillus lacus]TCS73558.1 epoxyqueuosine reductase [Effusibacillus lacus]GAX91948.1 tRNA epoxyqueuosine(34) reductase QueG [Effusibacillus lacus]